MDWWQIIIAVIGVLFAASWAAIIPTCVKLWRSLSRIKADYQAAMADGIITDVERQQIAEGVIEAISHAGNIFQFIVNLIAAIDSVINKARARRVMAKRL